MRQIAYVGEDGETSVYDLDTDEQTPVSRIVEPVSAMAGDRLTNWPTWSPSGDRLAYFRYEIANEELIASGVCVVAPDGSDPISVYHAQGEAPIYMCWSPNGERIALLVQAQDQLYLRVIDARMQRPPGTVAQGAPLYFTWQPDSQGLVVNVGIGRGADPRTRIVWLRLEGGQVSRAPLGTSVAAGFRAPCWSSQLNAAILALEGPDGSGIVAQGAPEGEPMPLVSTGASPAYCVSPAGDTLAYASRLPENGSSYGGISILQLNVDIARELVDDPVLAFFWSPNGRRLVYVGGDIAERMVSVHSVDVVSGERSDVGWVRPSRDLLMMFSHFDQYVQSTSLVSPDGQELILAASRAKERENGSVPTVRQILLRSLSMGGQERGVARGRLAFWRPLVNGQSST